MLSCVLGTQDACPWLQASGHLASGDPLCVSVSSAPHPAEAQRLCGTRVCPWGSVLTISSRTPVRISPERTSEN